MTELDRDAECHEATSGLRGLIRMERRWPLYLALAKAVQANSTVDPRLSGAEAEHRYHAVGEALRALMEETP